MVRKEDKRESSGSEDGSWESNSWPWQIGVSSGRDVDVLSMAATETEGTWGLGWWDKEWVFGDGGDILLDNFDMGVN